MTPGIPAAMEVDADSASETGDRIALYLKPQTV